MQGIMGMRLNQFIQKNLLGDRIIWMIVFFLNTIGMLIQFSAKGKFSMNHPIDPLIGLIKPIIVLFVSFAIMAWTSQQDYTKLTRNVNVGLYISWVLILIAFFYGTEKGGASRWIEVGPVSFMPSDMAKLCLTICLSKILSTRQSDPNAYTWGVLIYIFLAIIITCALIMLSNFSTSIIIFLTSLVLLYFGRVPWKFIGSIFGIVCILGFGMVYFEITERAATIKSRIEIYLRRTLNESNTVSEQQNRDENYQLKRSFYAISTGALRPKGPGKSQYRYHLTQAESDFVFAIIIEEYSIVMGVVIAGLFLLFILRSLSVIKNCDRPLGGLISAGLSFSIVTQALINMFVSVGAIPVTGQPIPMVSAGGTSLLFTAISIGLILSVSRDRST
jgi:cell division protein FtsW